MQCVKPITIKQKTRGLDGNFKELTVPCGKCLSCRIKKRQEWALRCEHELSYWTDSMFLTLTYNDLALPANGSLVKKDLQLFIKRVRKNICDRRIKYFACGEYGDNNFRPHYHAIIFGLSLRKEDKELVMSCWDKCDWDKKSIRDNSFGLVEPESIRYVTQYIDKKYSGELEKEIYTDAGLETPFRILSQGIGAKYAIDNQKQIMQLGYISHNGIKGSIPRYYIKKLDLDVNELNKNAYFNECETNAEFCGIHITLSDAEKSLNSDLIQSIREGQMRQKKQHDKNLKAKISLKSRKL